MSQPLHQRWGRCWSLGLWMRTELYAALDAWARRSLKSRKALATQHLSAAAWFFTTLVELS